MTEKEKQILLKDLCARLPYRIKCQFVCSTTNTIYSHIYDNILTVNNLFKVFKNDCIVKPYLRPMSSMTEEEFKSLQELTELKYGQLELAEWDNGYKTLEFYLEEIPSDVVIKVFDWLNAHHFDYRGLIPKGLALEAPKDMYNIKGK